MTDREAQARAAVHAKVVLGQGEHPLVGEVCERVSAPHSVDCDNLTATWLAGHAARDAEVPDECLPEGRRCCCGLISRLAGYVAQDKEQGKHHWLCPKAWKKGGPTDGE